MSERERRLDAVDVEHVVATRDGYWVVRKSRGLPAAIARATAPDP